jgi:hypothetical protein
MEVKYVRKRVRNTTIAAMLAFTMTVQPMELALAANKQVQAVSCNDTLADYKRNENDAFAFFDLIDSLVPAYTGVKRNPKQTAENPLYYFRYNGRSVKYWSSHGTNGNSIYSNNGQAQVWGNAKTYKVPKIDSALNASYWKGGELEFVFLAACNQLSASYANPRATYAKAMTGSSKNLRVIAGYNGTAPGGLGDMRVVEEIKKYLKQGESVKSAWIRANIDAGAKYYCVLTHSGPSQYSRLPGFPGETYARPTNSTILRFSSANTSSSVAQPTSRTNRVIELENGLLMNAAINARQTRQILPNYALKSIPRKLEVDEMIPAMVFRDEDSVTVSGEEIGDTKVNFNKEDAVKRSKEWLDETIDGIESSELNNYEVTPLVMAEVALEGGAEVEETIGYTIEFPNTYKNVKVDDNQCNFIIDNSGVNNAVLDWADYKEIELEDDLIRLNKALDALSDEILPATRTRSAVTAEERTVEDAELIFSYDKASGLLVPSWSIEMKNGNEYTIDGVTSTVVVK